MALNMSNLLKLSWLRLMFDEDGAALNFDLLFLFLWLVRFHKFVTKNFKVKVEFRLFWDSANWS